MARKRKPHQIALDWVFAHILAPLFALFLHVLCRTLRWEVTGLENVLPFWENGRALIVPCWHGRLVLIPYPWWRYGHGDVYVLMGRNRNGELITRIVQRFNMKAVRGGSRIGGAEAMQEMHRLVRERGACLAFTPDGPHGPALESKMGMAQISRIGNVPIAWVSANAKWAVHFSTWDRFLMPLPFSKVFVHFSPPIFPEPYKDLSLEEYRDRIDEIGRSEMTALDQRLWAPERVVG